eukprot:11155177-Lingulodinium_polyedra.AAC.1
MSGTVAFMRGPLPSRASVWPAAAQWPTPGASGPRPVGRLSAGWRSSRLPSPRTARRPPLGLRARGVARLCRARPRD